MIDRYGNFLAALLFFLSVGAVSASIQWKDTTIERELPIGETMISGVFAFENTGSRAVRIRQVRTNCGCTAGNHARGAIEPGDEGQVTLMFNARGRRGLQRNRATVDLDVGGRREQHTLEFIVSIPELIRAAPQVIQWPAVAERAREPRTVRLDLEQRFEPSISKLEYDETLLEVVTQVDPEKPAETRLIIKPVEEEGDLPAGRSQIKVTAKTSDEREQTVSIFVLIR